jgi:hypothetical protein
MSTDIYDNPLLKMRQRDDNIVAYVNNDWPIEQSDDIRIAAALRTAIGTDADDLSAIVALGRVLAEHLDRARKVDHEVAERLRNHVDDMIEIAMGEVILF